MAPIEQYFGGHGKEVMKNMIEKYGEEKGKRVFYATANKKKKRAKKGSAIREIFGS